jgi:alginate O-acetyltransferase complex protein AlgI
MNFTSLTFLGFGILGVAALRLAPVGWPKNLAILALNALFLSSFAASPLQLAPLIFYVLAGYAAIRIVGRNRSGIVFALAIVGLVGVFVWMKQYAVLPLIGIPTFPILAIGLSYILFRVLHLVIDVAQDALEPPPFLSYLNYVFFFLSFVSGPIQRYEDFATEASLPLPPAAWDDVHQSMHRIVLGYFMVIVVSSAATHFMDIGSPMLNAALAGHAFGDTLRIYTLMVVAYLINMFANFAGYMHIVIGIGGLAGFRLPENFNHPFASKNFSDLWSRWHMTLSDWFKAYLFNPLLKALAMRWGSRRTSPYLAALAFFATFLVMGIWHGTTFQFLVYGVLLGVGITIPRIWQILMTAWLKKDGYKALCEKSWYYQLSRAATLGFFAIAMTCIWISLGPLEALLAPQGLAVVAITFVILTVGGALAGTAWDWAVVRIVAVLTDVGSPGGARFRNVILPPAIVFAGGAVLATALVGTTGVATGNSFIHEAAIILISATVFTSGAIAIGLLDGPAKRLFSLFLSPRRQLDAATAWMGLRIFVVANFAVLLASAVPQFIYRAF